MYMLLLDSPSPGGTLAEWTTAVNVLNRPVSTSSLISVCGRLMHFDVKIRDARIRTHDLWIRKQVCYSLGYTTQRPIMTRVIFKLLIIEDWIIYIPGSICMPNKILSPTLDRQCCSLHLHGLGLDAPRGPAGLVTNVLGLLDYMILFLVLVLFILLNELPIK